MEIVTHRDLRVIVKELESHPDFLVAAVWGKQGILEDLLEYLDEEGIYQYDKDEVTKWFYDGGYRHSRRAIAECFDHGYVDSDGYEYPIVCKLIEIGLVVEQ